MSTNTSLIGTFSGAPLVSSNISNLPVWLAAYTTPRHEKRIAQYLALRNIEHFLPLYSSTRKWKDGSRVTSELPLFPGYIFVRLRREQRIRVLEAPGVLWLVGSACGPSVLPEHEIETLRLGLHQLKVEPYAGLVAGERVRIKRGPLSGMEGVLLRRQNLHVVLTLDQIVQSFAVNVDAQDVEPVPLPRAQ